MNKYSSHVYVIPEDIANAQLARGFTGHHKVKDTYVKVVPWAGGWRHVLKTFEQIGRALADDCDAGTATLWDHEQLNHNNADVQRLVQTVKPFLF